MPMSKARTKPIQVVLFGIEECIADQLGGILRRENQTFRIAAFGDAIEVLQTTDGCAGQLVFCGAESRDVMSLLHSAKDSGHGPFVVAVTRNFDLKRWLDLLEAGADDYCLFPIDEEHIQWILNKIQQPASAADSAHCHQTHVQDRSAT